MVSGNWHSDWILKLGISCISIYQISDLFLLTLLAIQALVIHWISTALQNTLDARMSNHLPADQITFFLFFCRWLFTGLVVIHLSVNE